MKVNRCCRDNSRGVDSKSRKEGSCARWRRDLKFSGRGLQHIFCHSLSPYPLYISRSRFGQLQQLHRPCAVSLGITTILKNCFRMFTRPLRRFWSRGNPSPPLLPPPLPAISPSLSGYFRCKSSPVVRIRKRNPPSFCGISNCNVIYEFSWLFLTLRQDRIDRYRCLRDLKTQNVLER